MSERPQPTLPEKHVKCHVCDKQVPKSEARSKEGQEYMFHFCGPDCFNEWSKEQKQAHGETKTRGI